MLELLGHPLIHVFSVESGFTLSAVFLLRLLHISQRGLKIGFHRALVDIVFHGHILIILGLGAVRFELAPHGLVVKTLVTQADQLRL